MRIATFGIDCIDKDKFKTEGDILLNKPNYGLYGSTLINRNGLDWSSWLDFVESESFHIDKYYKGISYTLHKKSKICTINSYESYIDILYKYPKYDDLNKLCIDFDKLKLDYDAFHLTEKAFYEMRLLPDNIISIQSKEVVINDFYSYDCETWIIFNLDCINFDSIQNISTKLINIWDE